LAGLVAIAAKTVDEFALRVELENGIAEGAQRIDISLPFRGLLPGNTDKGSTYKSITKRRRHKVSIS
jgi:hypothetical protein